MSTKSAAALPAALREATGERFVIEAARRVHRALGDTNRLDLVRRLAQSPATVTGLMETVRDVLAGLDAAARRATYRVAPVLP